PTCQRACAPHLVSQVRGGMPDLSTGWSDDAGAGGDDGTRTHDLLVANQALYQLSYVPGKGRPSERSMRIERMVGLGGFEPPTLRLSGVRSNQLSYRPAGLRTRTALACRRSGEK